MIELPEAVETTPAEALKISREYINKALEELGTIEGPNHALAHVEMYLGSALIWLPELSTGSRPSQQAQPEEEA